MALLTLQPVNSGVVAVLLPNGEPAGHLKWIGGVWKFKAMGYEGADARATFSQQTFLIF